MSVYCHGLLTLRIHVSFGTIHVYGSLVLFNNKDYTRKVHAGQKRYEIGHIIVVREPSPIMFAYVFNRVITLSR